MSLSYQHILSFSGRWVLTGHQKSEQLRSPDLDQQSGPLPAVLLVRSQPPAYVEFLRVGGTAKAAGWSTPARPIERHGALSRHIPCAVTSCISCSDLHLPTVLAAATMEVFFFPGRVGEWGGWWRDVKTVFLTVWQLRPCTLRKLLLQPHWVVACISSKLLIISLSKVGHKLHSKRWAESYSSPTDFFWKVLHISQNYRFSSLAFFFLTNKKA